MTLKQLTNRKILFLPECQVDYMFEWPDRPKLVQAERPSWPMVEYDRTVIT